MTAEYVPTTEVIKRAYVSISTSGMPAMSRTADEERMFARMRFDRWLADHDAKRDDALRKQVRAEVAREIRAENLDASPGLGTSDKEFMGWQDGMDYAARLAESTP